MPHNDVLGKKKKKKEKKKEKKRESEPQFHGEIQFKLVLIICFFEKMTS